MASAYDPAFDALVMAAPIVDMVGDGRMEYDGPRCADTDCNTVVDNDGELCDECGDQPHEFQPLHGDGLWPNWCACGRIRAAALHTSCPTCRGAGGWQQHDGLIIECPRGCMTRDGAA